MRRGHGLLLAGLALIGVGLLGAIVTGVALSSIEPGDASRGSTPDRRFREEGLRRPFGFGHRAFDSPGQRIYYTGVGNDGPIEVDWDPGYGFGGMPGPGGRRTFVPMGCVRCHRPDGRGGPMGMMGPRIEVPDIRYETLTSEHDEGNETSPAWTEEDIARAIRDGVEPGGEELNSLMPRWNMDERDMKDTIDYLKELDER